MDRPTINASLIFRSLPLVFLFAIGAVQAQDHDLYIEGRITNAVTGEAIPFAQLTVRDQLDTNFNAPLWATVNGDYTRELYTSAVWEGGRYILEYSAEGFSPRTATIDVSNVEQGLDMRTAWRIDLDVELFPGGHSADASAHLGTCTYDPGRGKLRWQEKEARKAFPIDRYREERIVAHAAIIDSVSALDGVMLHGRVLSQWTEGALENVDVRIVPRDGGDPIAIHTDEYGFYIYALPYDQVYEITFTRDDLVSKSFVADLTGIPASVRENGIGTTLDIRLFGPLPDEDLSFLADPLGRMEYSEKDENLVWDMAMAGPILQHLESIVSRHSATSAR